MKRPNILFVFTDQQSLRAMGAYGNSHLHTPHMDAIANEGVRFDCSYCTSPVCSPARASLFSGRMPHEAGVDTNGHPIDPSLPQMGDIFEAAGYETAYAGKWHLPYSYPKDSRLEYMPGFEYLPAGREGLGVRTDESVTDRAVEFLKRDHDKPFLLSVSLHNPHDICHWVFKHNKVEDRRAELLGHIPSDAELPPLPENFDRDAHEAEFIQTARQRDHYGQENIATVDWDETEWRRYLWVYYRLTELIDVQVGRMLTTLKEQGLEDNTLVVFTSDHGEGMAAHQWVVKLMFWDNVVRVPLALRLPGTITPGQADATHLVSGVDILPTLCDYAGIAPPDGCEGVSIRPVIENPDTAGREFVVVELQPDPEQMDRMGRMVVTDRYKYCVFSYGERPEMLFDLKADPGETNNLAGEPAMQDELKRHRDPLAGWIQRTNDQFKFPANLA